MSSAAVLNSESKTSLSVQNSTSSDDSVENVHSNEVTLEVVEMKDQLQYQKWTQYLKMYYKRNSVGLNTIFFYCITFVVLFSMMWVYSDGGSTKLGDPVRISCRSWMWADEDSCGLNGYECTPFKDGSMVFQCPGRCAWPDDSLKVWGNNMDGYHGKSRICRAAIHSGKISRFGGCANLSLVGTVPYFQGTKGDGGVTSLTMKHSFYKSYKIESVSSSRCYGFIYQKILLILSFLLFSLSILIPENIMKVPLFLLVVQPVIFSCFYLNMIQSPSGSSKKDIVDTLGNFSILIPFTMIIYYFSKNTIFAIINSDAMKTFPARVEGYSCYYIPNRCLLSYKTSYIILYLCPFFVMKNMSWIAAGIPGFDVDLDSSIFESNTSGTFGQVMRIIILCIMGIGLIGGGYFFFRIWYKEKKLLHLSISYSSYIVTMIIIRLIFLPGLFFYNTWGLHLHHASVAVILWWIINVKKRGGLFCAGLLCGTFCDGICTWNQTNFLNIFTPPEVNQGFNFEKIPKNFNITSGNMKSLSIDQNSIEVSFPSNVYFQKQFENVNLQGLQLVLNQMIIFEKFQDFQYGAAVKCVDESCTYKVSNLEPNTEHLFRYSVRTNGNEIFYENIPEPFITKNK